MTPLPRTPFQAVVSSPSTMLPTQGGMATLLSVPSELAFSLEESLQLPVVWACIRKIVNAIASAPISVAQRGVDGTPKHVPENALNHLLNTEANCDQTAQSAKEQLLCSALLYGSGYWRIIWDGSGRVQALRPLASRRVGNIKRAASGRLLYEYSNPTTNQVEVIPDADMIRLDGPASLEALVGQSTVDAAALAIALSMGEATFSRSYFANNATVGLVVKPPASVVTDAQRAGFRETIRALFSGKKAHTTAIVPKETEFSTLPVNAKDSMLVESRKLSSAEVCAFFEISPALLGIDVAYAAGYGSNQSHFRQEFVELTLRPWVNRVCQELNRKLFPERKMEVLIDLTHIMRGTFVERCQAYQQAVGRPWLTPDEAREAEGYSPNPDLNNKPEPVVVPQPQPTEPQPEPKKEPADA